MVARQHDDMVISDIDKDLREPEMYLCVMFSCSTPDYLAGVCGQRDKHTDRQIFYHIVKRGDLHSF